MKLKFCAACNERDDDLLQHHPILSPADGGCDDETNFITLCFACFVKLYGKNITPQDEIDTGPPVGNEVL